MTNRIDMSQFVAPKSDQLNADDLIAGPKTIRITNVTANSETAADQPISVHYEGGEGRPYKPCKSMRRLMMFVWGKYADQYIGRSMTLYRDPDVTFGADKTGGIRISHMSHIEERQRHPLTNKRGSRKLYEVKPLAVGADANRAKAEAWAQDQLAAIAAADSNEALDAILRKSETARTKLASQYPDLSDKLSVAISQARDGLDGDDDPFAGPSDNDRGETPDIAAALEAIRTAETEEAVHAAYDGIANQASNEDLDTLISAKNARLAELVE